MASYLRIQFKFVEYPPEEKEDVLIGQSVHGPRRRGGGETASK